MKYLVRINDLKKKTDFLEKEIDKIREYVNNIKEARNSLVWEGEARKTFDKIYEEYLSKLSEMLKGLIKILLYYKSFYNNYDDEYRSLKTKYQDLLMEEENDELY